MKISKNNFVLLISLFVSHLLGCGEFDSAEKTEEPQTVSVKKADAEDRETADEQKNQKGSEGDGESEDETPADDNGSEGEDLGGYRKPCELSAEDTPQTFSISSITALINKLPNPVSIPCVIDVLPRPLAVNATSSALSVQPADGESNPRIFIKIDSLLITFALSEEGLKALEFSDLLSTNRSVKGEIAFPVTESLPEDAAYQQVILANGTGSGCAGCHSEEDAAGDGYPDSAFASRALRPFADKNITIIELDFLKQACEKNYSLRCQILRSLFRGETPGAYEFPILMPTMF